MRNILVGESEATVAKLALLRRHLYESFADRLTFHHADEGSRR